ncbi:MAG TPA: Gfo/Idh/MocA family oxidoreductase [Firmicutes bacterium]|nr:Gfo/Idh/MocA family oxidoreductase [Bacillota bacterium]
MPKKRYAIVGVGSRARLYYQALASAYRETSEIAAFCDINPGRMDYANSILVNECGAQPVPTYLPWDFEKMVQDTKPDVVIVTSIDRTHHIYINKAMELGCDVITEKPLTIDEEKCQSILDTVKKTGRNLRVTFNYRYAPYNSKIRELICERVIGDVTSVHFEWLLDTKHGADYFRRWHRDKRNSGGLLVHKATHHFDLVNFWLGARPKTVFAMGDLLFYGRENAERRGMRQFYYRGTGSKVAADDAFALDLRSDPDLERMYLQNEKYDGYLRDQSVFGDGISIEDTMAVMVRYDTKAILTYSLNAYMPWEGYRVAFNGTDGRIEVNVCERSYVSGGTRKSAEGAVERKEIVVLPMFGEPYKVEVQDAEGGHGGGDPALLRDLFGEPQEDPLNRAASHIDGALSIAVGMAANKSMRTGQAVQVDELFEL